MHRSAGSSRPFCRRKMLVRRNIVTKSGLQQIISRSRATEQFASNQVSSELHASLSSSGLKYNDDLFNYTRGRFLFDDAHEISQRHVRFDVNALARCAAEAAGAEMCTSIEKFPDGMFNKSMLLTMSNGSQVVAKVPNPNAGMASITTASEVATMDFVRSISVPDVPT